MSEFNSPSAPTPPPLPVDTPLGYAQPSTLAYAAGGMPVPYLSARRRAKVVIALSWAMIGMQVLLVWPFVAGMMSLRTFASAEDAWEAEFSAADIGGAVMVTVYIPLFVVATVFWFMWVYRTYRNLPALGAEGLRFSPGWAVGYAFIPVLNLFRPFQVMRETWRASDARYDGGTNWMGLAAPALLGWWWAMHLVSLVVHLASIGIHPAANELRTLQLLAWVDLAMLAFDAALLWVEIRIVRGLTDLQERRADALGIPDGAGAPAGASPGAPAAGWAG